MHSSLTSLLRSWPRLGAGITSAVAVATLSSCAFPFLPTPGGNESGPTDSGGGAGSSDSGGGGGNQDLEYRTGPIPSEPVTFSETITRDNENSDDPALQVEGELSAMVQEFAMVRDDSVVSVCDSFDPDIDVSVSCTSTFHGIDIPWEVDIVSSEEFTFEYDPVPSEGLVASRDNVEDEMRWTSEAEAVHCTMEEWQMVPIDETVSDISCYAEGDPTEYTVRFDPDGTIWVE